ncbi:hypothetical protein KW787_02455 [Candidatus Pacearchaeota archaeon]|nr:hypothetical protein [Candidatus Pacearchaeota archaeon]
MNRKSALMLGILTLFVLSSISFVLAAESSQAAAAASGFAESIQKSFSPLFSDHAWLTRILLWILLFMIIYEIVGLMFGSSRGSTWAIAGIISTLAMIGIPATFLAAITTEYGAMGAAILSVIPFIIVLIFTVRVQSLLVARIVWVFFCVYYFSLYLYEYFSIKAADPTHSWLSPAVIPYLGALVAGIIIIFVIGTIRNAIFKGQMQSIREEGREVAQRGKLLHRLQNEELEGSYGAGGRRP